MNSVGGDLEQRSGSVDELAAQCNDNLQVDRLPASCRLQLGQPWAKAGLGQTGLKFC